MSIQWKLKVVHCTLNKLKLILCTRFHMSCTCVYVCVCVWGGGGGGGGGAGESEKALCFS